MKIKIFQTRIISAGTVAALLLSLTVLGPARLIAAPESPSPDVLVGKKFFGPFKGDGVKNATGAGQTLARKTTGKSTKTWFEIQNDTLMLTFFLTVTATRGNRNFKTQYFAGPQNVTAAITAKGILAQAGAGMVRKVLQKVKPTRKIRSRNRTRKFLVKAASTSPPLSDAARSVIRKKDGR